MVDNLTLDDAIEVNRLAKRLSLQELSTKSSDFLRYNFFKLTERSDFLDLEEEEM